MSFVESAIWLIDTLFDRNHIRPENCIYTNQRVRAMQTPQNGGLAGRSLTNLVNFSRDGGGNPSHPEVLTEVEAAHIRICDNGFG